MTENNVPEEMLPESLEMGKNQLVDSLFHNINSKLPLVLTKEQQVRLGIILQAGIDDVYRAAAIRRSELKTARSERKGSREYSLIEAVSQQTIWLQKERVCNATENFFQSEGIITPNPVWNKESHAILTSPGSSSSAIIHEAIDQATNVEGFFRADKVRSVGVGLPTFIPSPEDLNAYLQRHDFPPLSETETAKIASIDNKSGFLKRLARPDRSIEIC